MIRWLYAIRTMRRGAALLKYPRPQLAHYLRPRGSIFHILGSAIELGARWEEVVRALAPRHVKAVTPCRCVGAIPATRGRMLVICTQCQGVRGIAGVGPYR